ncbi:SH3 domain-containing protein [beta proteobacterium MWH-UniP1]
MFFSSVPFKSCLLCIFLVCSAGIGLAQELAVPAPLRAEPTADSKALKQLPANAPVKVLRRQGFYLEVESGGAKGWLKASEVSTPKGAGGGLSNLDSGRSGKGNIVSTSAARGLSSKDVIASKPDHLQVEELKKLGVSASAADDFATQGGLQNRKLALLAAPPQGVKGRPTFGPTSRDGKASQGSPKRSADRKKSGDGDDDDD